MTKLKLSATVCLIASLGAGTAQAQTEAAAVKLGAGIDFTPTLNLDLLHDDNVLNADTDEIDSLVAIINPNFLLSADDGVSAYSLNYSLVNGEYFDSEEDNYTDHFLTGDAGWELNARNRVDLSASYTDGHQARGVGFSQAIGSQLEEPDSFQRNDVNGTYTFGADTAKGQIALQLGTTGTTYDGRLTDAGRDFDTNYGSATFSYNAGGKTRLLLEVGRSDIAYDTVGVDTLGLVGSEPLDSTEMRYLLGVTWDGSAKTSGTVRVGALSRDFDSEARADYSGPSWEVELHWEPRTYSTFDFSTSRSNQEATGLGDFNDVTNYNVSWNHDWADRLSSEVNLGHSIFDFQGESLEREEEVNTGTLRFNYQMQRWLGFNAGVIVADNDSTVAGFSYQKNVTFIGLQASL